VGGQVQIGFFKANSHELVDVRDCLIQPEVNGVVIEAVRAWIRETGITVYNPRTHEGLMRHVVIRHSNVTGGLMVVLVANGTKLTVTPDAGREKAVSVQDLLVQSLLKASDRIESIVVNTNTRMGSQVLGDRSKVIYGKEKILGRINEFEFGISPRSFFQVNTAQTEVLYGKAMEFAALTGKETVFDVYCGIGTISMFLSRHAEKVYGIESVQEAIEDAKKNATRSKVKNVEFLAGRAEVILPQLAEQGIFADVVVVDPPRKGCDPEVLTALLDLKPERIVYVSCKPATLARDLKILCGGEESGEEIGDSDEEKSGERLREENGEKLGEKSGEKSGERLREENGEKLGEKIVERCRGRYTLAAVQPVDMFGMTGHVETIILMTRSGSGEKK
jgi:23S rRNA (uracil1939-C5)-methyltransferase